MGFAEELKKSGVRLADMRSAPRSGPLWTGPQDNGPQGGVTFSLLSRWLCCRERFRLYALEGLGLPDKFNHRLEYGNFWHLCEEAYAKGDHWEPAILRYATSLAKRYPLQQEEVEKWYHVCKVQFPVYADYWAKHPSSKTRRPLLQEEVFCVPYLLPTNQVVYLRGKQDSIDLEEVAGSRNKESVVILQENKTKGDIDEEQIKRQLKFDLQTMLYLIAMQAGRGLKPLVDVWPKGARLGGVRYNVVRRPLAGGRYTIRQHKDETLENFYLRLGEIIRGDSEWFFMRWSVDIDQTDIDVFRRTCLDPILVQLCAWYDWSVAKSGERLIPLDPNYLHYRMPYGVYNTLLEGAVGELDRVIDTGTKVGLRRLDTLFPELTPVTVAT